MFGHGGTCQADPRDLRPQRDQAPWRRRPECHPHSPWHRGQTSECLPTWWQPGKIQAPRDRRPQRGHASECLPTLWPNHSDVRPWWHLPAASEAPRDLRPQRGQAPWRRRPECHPHSPWHRGQTSECLPTWWHLGRSRPRAIAARSVDTPQNVCPPCGRIIPMFGHGGTCQADPGPARSPAAVDTPQNVVPTLWPNHSDVRPWWHLPGRSEAPAPSPPAAWIKLRGAVDPSATLTLRGTNGQTSECSPTWWHLPGRSRPRAISARSVDKLRGAVDPSACPHSPWHEWPNIRMFAHMVAPARQIRAPRDLRPQRDQAPWRRRPECHPSLSVAPRPNIRMSNVCPHGGTCQADPSPARSPPAARSSSVAPSTRVSTLTLRGTMAKHQNVCPHGGTCQADPSPARSPPAARSSSVAPSTRVPPSLSVARWPNIRMFAHMVAPGKIQAPRDRRPQRGHASECLPTSSARIIPMFGHGGTCQADPRPRAISARSAIKLRGAVDPSATLTLRGTEAKHQNVCPHGGSWGRSRPRAISARSVDTPQNVCPPRGRIIPMFGHGGTCQADPSPARSPPAARSSSVALSTRVPPSLSVAPRPNIQNVCPARPPPAARSRPRGAVDPQRGHASALRGHLVAEHSECLPTWWHLPGRSRPRAISARSAIKLRGAVDPSATLTLRGTEAKHQNVCPHGGTCQAATMSPRTGCNSVVKSRPGASQSAPDTVSSPAI